MCELYAWLDSCGELRSNGGGSVDGPLASFFFTVFRGCYKNTDRWERSWLWAKRTQLCFPYGPKCLSSGVLYLAFPETYWAWSPFSVKVTCTLFPFYLGNDSTTTSCILLTHDISFYCKDNTHWHMHTQAPSFNYQNARVIFFTALQKFGTGRRDCLISDCLGLGCWPLQAAVVWCSDHLAS